MKSLILICAIFLAGCTTVPVERKFPELPVGLKDACPELEQVKASDPKASEVLKTIANNYSEYHSCRLKVDSWLKWYAEQKEIFNSVK